MQTPPPVSGEAFPTEIGPVRSNFLGVGVVLNTGYVDNVPGSSGNGQVGNVTYMIRPTLTFDQTTSRQHRTFTYTQSFTFYQPTSSMNELDQSATASFQYRLSPYTTVTAGDTFDKTSNVFNQPSLLTGPVTGSGQPSPATVIVPFAHQIINSTNAGIGYQFSRNGLIGASASFGLLNYPNPSEASGLSNSTSQGFSGFYGTRLAGNQYIGVAYQYGHSVASPQHLHSVTQGHSVVAFYTMYLDRSVSLSVSGGPQYYNTVVTPVQTAFPSTHAWAPELTASIGWQKSHANFAGSYSRLVTGGGGLQGAYHLSGVNAFVGWQMARTWTLESGGKYSITNKAGSEGASFNQNGHTISGSVSLKHTFGDHINAELGYSRLNQSYSGIAAIANTPDSNREYFSITYQFTRPLGR